MAEDPNVIRQNIEQTRSALTEKLETLEAEVKGTVQGAKATVDNTIETVKSTVQETIHSVKRTFDLAYQTEQHPWPMVGGSVVAGFVCGHLFDALTAVGRHHGHGFGHAPRYEPPRYEPPPAASSLASQSAAAADRPNGFTGGPSAAPSAGESSMSSLLQWVSRQFGPEIEQLKGMAIGAAVGVVRDLVKRNIPEHLGPQVEEVMNNITSKLGGQPVRGEVLSSAGQRQTQGPAHW
jgi:ElaB/YqjD/DUF883 family membrane-anchored ribosome-binding protein